MQNRQLKTVLRIILKVSLFIVGIALPTYTARANDKSVLDGNTLFCRLTYKSDLPLVTSDDGNEVPVPTGSTIFTLNQTLERGNLLVNVGNWVNHLRGAGDPIFNPISPLCVGLINDFDGANAHASLGSHINVGIHLLIEARRDFRANYPYALKFVLAHEFAHIIQQRHQLYFEYPLPMLSSRIRELHADCMAGYLLQTFREIPFASTGGVQTFVGSLGSDHVVSTHGISSQRIEALNQGMRFRTEDETNLNLSRTNTTTQHMLNRCNMAYAPTPAPLFE